MHQKIQRSVIRFLSSEGVKPIEIHGRMKVQYVDACLSLQQVYGCTRQFMNSISSVTDSPRPGQAHRWWHQRALQQLKSSWRKIAVLQWMKQRHIWIWVTDQHTISSVMINKKYLRFSFDSPSYTEVPHHQNCETDRLFAFIYFCAFHSSLPCSFNVIQGHAPLKEGGPSSSVGIVTGYGLDGPNIESLWGRDFPHLSRPALRPTQPPAQWVLSLFRG